MLGLRLPAIAAAVFASAADGSAETVHRFDGMCLSFDTETVAYFTDNPAARRGSPLLALPDDYVSGTSSSEGGFELSVSYRKRSEAYRQELLNRALNPADDDCARRPEATGLSRLLPSDRPRSGTEAPPACTRSASHTRYIPTEPTEKTAAVRVRCANNEGVLRCRLTTLLDNNWEAEVSLAKADLEHWQAVSQAAASFFHDNLTDCEEK